MKNIEANTQGRGVRVILTLAAVLFTTGVLGFLLWRGRQPAATVPDQQIMEFLRDDAEPGVIQYGLAQIRQRMQRQEPVAQFYPELTRLSMHRSEDVRRTIAEMLAIDTSRPEFHQALLAMLHQSSPDVRNAAAVSLAQFGDGAGREQIVSMLEPQRVTAPQAGRVQTVVAAGAHIGQGEVIARLIDSGDTIEVRSPITGRVPQVFVGDGDEVSAGVRLAIVTPGSEQALTALRALQRVGQMQDLTSIAAYVSSGVPQEVLHQAKITEQAIRARQ